MTKHTKLSGAKLERARADTRLAIIGELGKLIERLSVEGAINQSRIAERLGVSRAYISKLLSGPDHNNWTLNKIGELLAAVDSRVWRIDMRPVNEIPAANEIHPWLESKIGVERLQPSAKSSHAQDESRLPIVSERPPRLRNIRINRSIGAPDVMSETAG